jgi:phage protein D
MDTSAQDTGVASTRLYSAQPLFKIEGTAQPSLADSLILVEVSDDVRGMARLEARFENWGTPPGGGEPGFMFFDGGVLAFAKQIDVDMGPSNASRTVFSGRISLLGATFSAQGIPEFAIAAEDALQTLRMTRRTKTYENVTDAAVARTIAGDHSLQVDADAPGPTHKVLVQLGQTDLAFLRERAAAIDAQLWIDSGRMKFRARSDRDGGTVNLSLGDTLSRFSVLADLAHQVVAVHGHGYDVSSKSDVDQTADRSLLSSETNGARSGAEIFSSSFGAREEHVLTRTLASTDEASYFAKAELRQRGRAFVRCRGETEGTAAMVVGSKLKISGVGPSFSGTYFATQVTHRYDRLHGYKTLFQGERPAVGQES